MSEENMVSSTTDENSTLSNRGEGEGGTNTELVVMPSTSGYQSDKSDNKKKIDEAVIRRLEEWRQQLKFYESKDFIKNIIVSIDEDLLSESILHGVPEILLANGINYHIVKLDHPSVCWAVEDIYIQCFKKLYAAIVLNPIKFMFLAENDMFMDYFIDMTKEIPVQKICLVLCGRVFREEIMDQIDELLCEVEVSTGMSCWKFDKSDELAMFFVNITKSASEEPYRTEIEKYNADKTFYLQGRSHNCVDIDKDNNGMKNLWVQQISALHRLPLDHAKVVSATYPTPLSLYGEYSKLSSVKEKQELLQDVDVGRPGVKKRLGPKMSKRIALLFGNSDGDLRPSNWT